LGISLKPEVANAHIEKSEGEFPMPMSAFRTTKAIARVKNILAQFKS
jgi:hypothetical protein